MQIGIIIEDEFNDAIERYCKKTNQSKSEYVRGLIREDLIRKKFIPLIKTTEAQKVD